MTRKLRSGRARRRVRATLTAPRPRPRTYPTQAPPASSRVPDCRRAKPPLRTHRCTRPSSPRARRFRNLPVQADGRAALLLSQEVKINQAELGRPTVTAQCDYLIRADSTTDPEFGPRSESVYCITGLACKRSVEMDRLAEGDLVRTYESVQAEACGQFFVGRSWSDQFDGRMRALGDENPYPSLVVDRMVRHDAYPISHASILSSRPPVRARRSPRSPCRRRRTIEPPLGCGK